MPARDIDGNWSNPVMMKGVKGISPLSILDVTMDTQKESLLTTGYLELKPVKDLTVLGTLGMIVSLPKQVAILRLPLYKAPIMTELPDKSCRYSQYVC